MSAKTESAIPKMSDTEIAEYYVSVHRNAIRANPQDELTPVIDPGNSHLEIRFVDFAHRLGMKKAFTYLHSRLCFLTGLSVLDVGCGRGRWTKEYARRGACVTGVDISQEAIELLTTQLPEHRFLCQDLTRLELPADAFDVINSVTVLQHLTYDNQRIVLGSIARSLKNGGYLVLLENVADFDAPHVFPRTTEEWIGIVQATGLRCHVHWGSNFAILPPQPQSGDAPSSPRSPRGASRGYPPANGTQPGKSRNQRLDCAFFVPRRIALSLASYRDENA